MTLSTPTVPSDCTPALAEIERAHAVTLEAS
jgi:hypothetical protein